MDLLLTTLLAAAAAAEPPAPDDADPLPVLGELVVLGSRRPEPLRQVVGTVSRLDAEQLDRRNVRTIEDLARLVPGLEVVADANRFGAQGFNLRGLEGNRVGIELDGVPQADGFGIGQFALSGRDLIDLGLVERAEVLRGPASTLHGSKALAGVVAFWTPDPLELDWRDGARFQSRWRLGASGRDEGFWASARGAWRSADGDRATLAWLGRRQGHETANAADDPAAAANPARVTQDAVLLRTGGHAGDATWGATLEQGMSSRQTDVQSLLFGPGRFSTTFALTGDDRQRRDRASATVEWARAGTLDSLQLLAYRQSTETDQRSDQYRLADRATPFLSRRERRFLFTQDSLGLELVAQKRLEWGGARHWMVFGTDLAQHDYRGLRDGVETNLATGAGRPVILGEIFPLRDFPNTLATELGLFWQDEIALGEDWALVPGLRWEHYRLRARADALWREDNPTLAPASLDDQDLTPKLGLRWNRGALGLYAQFARGFRAPPFGDVNIGLNLPAFNYVAIPNPDLRPERSDGLELGLRWSGPSLQLGLAVYESRFRDLIESRANLGRNADGQLVFQSVNRDRARIRGAEFEARAWFAGPGSAADGLYLHLAANWSEGRDTARDRVLNSVPPPRATLALGFEAADERWGGELRLAGVRRVREADQATGPLFLPPGYSRWDLHAWWSAGEHLRLVVTLENLADRRYWDWSALRGLPAGADDIDFHSRPGRTASFGLRMDF